MVHSGPDPLMLRGMTVDINERMVVLRRDLHRQPELSWEESGTAARICRELDELGIEYRAGVARTGIVADLPGGEGPRVALRADMDALPIQEESGEPFSSETPGVMHACGHDGHVAMVVGAAARLVAHPPPGPVRLLFQPAEELGEGARAMVEGGALDGVDFVFGAHIDLHYPVGTIVAMAGTLNASTDDVEITVTGRQAHAARPHEGADALVAAADLVLQTQRLVTREVDPGDPAVITLGQMEAGVAPNVVAGRAVLRGTVRAQTPGTRAHLLDGLTRLAATVATSHRVAVDCVVIDGTPPVINTPEIAPILRRAATDVAGKDVVPLRSPNLGGEDFAFYLVACRGGFLRLGAQPTKWNGSGAHSAGFRFDERVLPIGAHLFERLCHRAAEAD